MIRASLVDLFVIEGDEDGSELIVEPVAQSRLGKQETGTLLAWATRVGYRRVWLPNNVIYLEPQLAGGSASVRCRACGARWEDGSPNFWLHVREQGHFPGMCPVCGDSLPEWEVDSALPFEEEATSDEWSQLRIVEAD